MILNLFKLFCQGSVVFVSFLSSFPGFLLLLPAPAACMIINNMSSASLSLHKFVASSAFLSYSLAGYLLLISYFIFCSLALYAISESNYRMPVIDFLGREFTKRFLGDPRDHTVRVIVVPTLIFCMLLIMTHTSGGFSH